MKSYLEIKVPIHFGDSWFEELRRKLPDANIWWQKDYYHITMVFVDIAPSDEFMCSILDKHLRGTTASVITFDKLDVFEVFPNGMQIVNLTSSETPQNFIRAIDNIRTDIKSIGGIIQSNFRLHVTLGRIKQPNIEIKLLADILNSIQFSPITLQLSQLEYREFRGRSIYTNNLKCY